MDGALVERLLLQRDVEDFFAMESELIDERRFDEWLDLFAEDAHYWMPIARNVAFDDVANEYSREQSDANWFDEGKHELRSRVAQIQSGDHWAEEPRSRTTHVVAGVRVTEHAGDDVTVKSRFVVCQNRLARDIDVFIGKRVDRLARRDSSFAIVHRTVFLDQNVLLSKYLTTFF
jgi:3-phenylpropionate/cinnamic acid dioxygenase small subunit